jgi:probable phosphoglycerate mutase
VSASQIVLWRHGRTGYNHTERVQGQLAIDLDGVGRGQTAAAAAVLAERKPDAVVSSDLRRARDTAQALADLTGLAVRTDPALREIYAGAWQGLSRAQIVAGWADDFAAWRRGEDVARRAAASIRQHAQELGDRGQLVVVAHGGSLRGALTVLLDLPPEAYASFAAFRNAHWAVLDRVGSGWVLSEYNVGPTVAAEGLEG